MLHMLILPRFLAFLQACAATTTWNLRPESSLPQRNALQLRGFYGTNEKHAWVRIVLQAQTTREIGKTVVMGGDTDREHGL